MQQTFTRGPADAAQRVQAALEMTPTGRAILLGTFALPVETVNPSTAGGVPVDGYAVLYLNGASLTLYAYTRATGWLGVVLS